MYPEAMRQHLIGGQVVLQAIVDSNGVLDRGSLEVIASTRREFHLAALTALRTCRYRPAFKDGRPIAVRIQSAISFWVEGYDRPRVPGW